MQSKNTDQIGKPEKKSFKAQMLLTREAAIISVVNKLLAEKGFDAMTVDEVADNVGIAKASLYKHFASKEMLAAAAMAQVMQKALAFVANMPMDATPIEKLQSITRWMMSLKLAGEMPSLPNQNSSLRVALMQNTPYMEGLMAASAYLSAWIQAAQASGDLNNDLPVSVILLTLYARACDPVLEFLKMTESYTDAQIIDLVMQTCFMGLVKVSDARR